MASASDSSWRSTCLNLTPDQEYLMEGQRDGWITLQTVGIDALELDTEHFQARAVHLDIDWCRRLASIRDARGGEPLDPIVAFYLIESHRYLVADGFHRVHEAKSRLDVSIPVLVVKVDDPRRGALEFATMCNREMSKGRTKDDLKRAVLMLHKDDVWNPRADKWIADHIGMIAVKTVRRYREEYDREHDIDRPEVVLVQRGDGEPYLMKKPKQRRTDPVIHDAARLPSELVPAIDEKREVDEDAIQSLARRIVSAVMVRMRQDDDPDREEIDRRYRELVADHSFAEAARIARETWVAERITEFINGR